MHVLRLLISMGQCMQVAGWCQDMCLNRARQRRRHRRTVEDWAHLYDHAANADMSPEFQIWMAQSGWQWQMKDGDPQVHTSWRLTSREVPCDAF